MRAGEPDLKEERSFGLPLVEKPLGHSADEDIGVEVFVQFPIIRAQGRLVEPEIPAILFLSRFPNARIIQVFVPLIEQYPVGRLEIWLAAFVFYDIPLIEP